MAETRSEERARERKKLLEARQKEARRLLELIGNEIRRFRPDSRVETFPGLRLLQINGYPVELSIRPSFQHGNRRLNVHLPPVYAGVSIRAKTFGYSTKRPESFGFDVPKIARACLDWKERKIAIETELKSKNAEKDKWKKAASRILDQFPSTLSTPLKLTASAQGLTLTTTLKDEQRIIELLKVLAEKE